VIAPFATASQLSAPRTELGSPLDADDPKSIPTQRADCRTLAEEIGADVIGEFVDKGRSGYDRRYGARSTRRCSS